MLLLIADSFFTVRLLRRSQDVYKRQVLEHHDFFFDFPEAIRELNGVAMKFVDNLEAE